MPEVFLSATVEMEGSSGGSNGITFDTKVGMLGILIFGNECEDPDC